MDRMSLSLIVLSQSHDLDFRATSAVLQRVSSALFSSLSTKEASVRQLL